MHCHVHSNDALKEFGAKESLYLRIRRQRMGIEDFETIKVIGRGAFGEVRLCRSGFRVRVFVFMSRPVHQACYCFCECLSVCARVLLKTFVCMGPGHCMQQREYFIVYACVLHRVETRAHVCRKKDESGDQDAEIYAVKVLRKTEMRQKDQVSDLIQRVS